MSLEGFDVGFVTQFHQLWKDHGLSSLSWAALLVNYSEQYLDPNVRIAVVRKCIICLSMLGHEDELAKCQEFSREFMYIMKQLAATKKPRKPSSLSLALYVWTVPLDFGSSVRQEAALLAMEEHQEIMASAVVFAESHWATTSPKDGEFVSALFGPLSPGREFLRCPFPAPDLAFPHLSPESRYFCRICGAKATKDSMLFSLVKVPCTICGQKSIESFSSASASASDVHSVV